MARVFFHEESEAAINEQIKYGLASQRCHACRTRTVARFRVVHKLA